MSSSRKRSNGNFSEAGDRHLILPSISPQKPANVYGDGLVRNPSYDNSDSVLQRKPNLLAAAQKSRNTLRYTTSTNILKNHGSSIDGAINRAMFNPYGEDKPLLGSMSK